MGLIKVTPADAAFSKCVRERAEWKCERCGAQHPPPTQALHCSHYHSRGHWSTRFDPKNVIAACYGCHNYLSMNREEYTKLMREIIGEQALDTLWHDHLRPAYKMKTRKKEIASHF